MKAPRPGGDGSYISITGFESNPQGYFRALITVTKLMERIRRLFFLWFFGLFVRSIYVYIGGHFEVRCILQYMQRTGLML